MMLEQIAALLASAKRVAPVPLIAVTVASSTLLFAGERIASTLGVDAFRDEYRSHIGVAFIASISYLVAHGFWWLRGIVLQRHRQSTNLRVLQGYLSELTHEERMYLAPFIVDDGVTCQNFGAVGLALSGSFGASERLSVADALSARRGIRSLQHLDREDCRSPAPVRI